MATLQRAVTVSSRTMGNPLVAWVRRLSDPLPEGLQLSSRLPKPILT